MDLCNLTDEQVEQILATGVPKKRIKDDSQNENDQGRGRYTTVYSSRKPKLKDSAGNNITDPVMLGAGAVCKTVVRPFDYTFKGKPGVSIGLEAVMIIDTGSTGNFDDLLLPEDGGTFTVDKSKPVFEDDNPPFDNLLDDEDELELA